MNKNTFCRLSLSRLGSLRACVPPPHAGPRPLLLPRPRREAHIQCAPISDFTRPLPWRKGRSWFPRPPRTASGSGSAHGVREGRADGGQREEKPTVSHRPSLTSKIGSYLNVTCVDSARDRCVIACNAASRHQAPQPSRPAVSGAGSAGPRLVCLLHARWPGRG